MVATVQKRVLPQKATALLLCHHQLDVGLGFVSSRESSFFISLTSELEEMLEVFRYSEKVVSKRVFERRRQGTR